MNPFPVVVDAVVWDLELVDPRAVCDRGVRVTACVDADGTPPWSPMLTSQEV
jgi:hypothetical protein